MMQRLGDFELDGVLGEGGSGTVYAARLGGQACALKVLRADVLVGPKEQARFLSEAQLLARIDHPGVVRLLGAGTLPDGRPFLAMPLLAGETLAARLARGRLAVDEALRLFGLLAEAVAALHAAGLVHRDLKPENVFLVRGGGGGGERPLLLDLGIARAVDAPPGTTTRSGLVRGTPAYMAPERFFGAPTTERSDVYELAVVLYLMLVGRLPWADSSDAEGRLLPLRPRDAGVELPGALEEVLLGALSTRPEQRPPDARAFATEVAGALRRSASAAAGRRTGEQVPKPALLAAVPAASARGGRRGLIAAGVVAIAAIGIVAWRRTSTSTSTSTIPSTSTSTSTSPSTSTSVAASVAPSPSPTIAAAAAPSPSPTASPVASASPVANARP
ncbi:MAG: serine/threonine protein kinase, partial [Deltaproteobacteria bacterium]|nr:serine/threonine protein kinase [Deltaproteobacteria bacterium]